MKAKQLTSFSFLFSLLVTTLLVTSLTAKEDSSLYLPLLMTERSKHWIVTFDGLPSQVEYIAETSDGDLLLAGRIGRTDDNQRSDFWLARVTKQGEPVWMRSYDASGFDNPLLATQVTADGGMVMAGHGRFDGDNDPWIIRVDAAGNSVWQKRYDDAGGNMLDFAEAIIPTGDGGYAVAGYTASFGLGISDLLVMKLNGDGSIAWQKTVHNDVYDNSQDIIQTGDGGFLIAGHGTDGNLEGDSFVLKIDADGNLGWAKVYPGVFIEDLQLGDNDAFMMAGSIAESGSSDVWVGQAAGDGVLTWQMRYGGEAEDTASEIRQTPDGFIVSGTSETLFPNSAAKGFLLKTSNTGSLLWHKTYTGNDVFTQFHAVSLIGDGGYAAAGTSGGTNPYGAWVLRVDVNGDVPNCDLIEMGDFMPVATQVTPVDASVTILESGLIPVGTSATPQTSLMMVNHLCPELSAATCNPD